MDASDIEDCISHYECLFCPMKSPFFDLDMQFLVLRTEVIPHWHSTLDRFSYIVTTPYFDFRFDPYCEPVHKHYEESNIRKSFCKFFLTFERIDSSKKYRPVMSWKQPQLKTLQELTKNVIVEWGLTFDDLKLLPLPSKFIEDLIIMRCKLIKIRKYKPDFSF